MKTEEDVEKLEKLIGQLDGLLADISQLAKKSPNDGLNKFKLKLVNTVLGSANELLGSAYTPFDDFREFGEEDLPTNSDVTLILTQYIEQTERFRSDNVTHDRGTWRYIVDGSTSKLQGRPPSRVGGKKT